MQGENSVLNNNITMNWLQKISQYSDEELFQFLNDNTDIAKSAQRILIDVAKSDLSDFADYLIAHQHKQYIFQLYTLIRDYETNYDPQQSLGFLLEKIKNQSFKLDDLQDYSDLYFEALAIADNYIGTNSETYQFVLSSHPQIRHELDQYYEQSIRLEHDAFQREVDELTEQFERENESKSDSAFRPSNKIEKTIYQLVLNSNFKQLLDYMTDLMVSNNDVNISLQLYEMIAEKYDPVNDMGMIYTVSGYTKEEKSRSDLLPNITLLNYIYSPEESSKIKQKAKSIIKFKGFDDWFILGEEQHTGYTVFVMTEMWPWWALVPQTNEGQALFLKIAKKMWQWLPWRYLPLDYED